MIALVALVLAGTPVQEAERLAAEAIRMAPDRPQEAETQARRALALTADFEPTAFVRAGRKGEVVEDEYQAARNEYRRHRAGLYEAVGEALARKGEAAAAARYLRRALLLERTPGRLARLAGALLDLGQGHEVLELLQANAGPGGMSPETLSLIARAADAAGAPSAQVEVDRARLRALGAGAVEVRDGPLAFPQGTRLSTGAPASLDKDITVVYMASSSCKTCSEDLEALKRAAPPGSRLVLVPEVPDQDQALRQVLRLYRHDWPLLLGRGLSEAVNVKPGRILVVARRGWIGVALDPPYANLGAVVGLLGRSDVQEDLPRKDWKGKRVERQPAAPPPALLPEGLAPGEDQTAPAEFARAVEAYGKGRYAEALRLFEALEAMGDGWFLPPEARLNRALSLAGLGRGEEARRLLLRTGDSRFQDAVDKTLERVGSRRR